MNNFKNFQAKHNLKLISFNNPKVVHTGTEFYTSNFITTTENTLTLPTYNEYLSKLNIKSGDILVYTILFTPLRNAECTGSDTVQVIHSGIGVVGGRDTVDMSHNNIQESCIKTPTDQHIIIRFYDTYYKVY